VFLYPEQTKFGRVLPKNKVYGHAKPSRAVRQRFVDEVEEIVWRHKLAPETLRLPAKPGVAEIQVFEIALKAPAFGEPALREDVLRTIDRAVPSLIFFELTFENRVRFAAAYKRASLIGGETGAAANQPVVETYFETPWQEATVPRLPLPVALDMAGLYEQMLRAHMLASPYALRPRTGESLPETVERGSLIRAKRRECKQLEAKLRKEAQFNRKVEINAQLRACLAALADLEA
jgi:hypothetical protein